MVIIMSGIKYISDFGISILSICICYGTIGAFIIFASIILKKNRGKDLLSEKIFKMIKVEMENNRGTENKINKRIEKEIKNSESNVDHDTALYERSIE